MGTIHGSLSVTVGKAWEQLFFPMWYHRYKAWVLYFYHQLPRITSDPILQKENHESRIALEARYCASESVVAVALLFKSGIIHC